MLICILVLATLFFVFGWDSRLKIVEYNIDSTKIDEELKIAIIADLHSCDYGENATEIFELLDPKKPDIVLLPGDIIDDDLPEDKAAEFLEVLSSKYKAYYVSGNHEFWSSDVESVKEIVRNNDIRVLEGEVEQIEIKGQKLNICGIDDPYVGEALWQNQIEKISKLLESESGVSENAGKINQDTEIGQEDLDNQDGALYSILLSHRPERVKDYSKSNADLVVAGHAHGGQWRIPFILNGLIAPNQGLFPKYAGGLYELDNNVKMLVSRGLARESTRYVPRIYNRPEIVIINLK